MKTPMKKAVLCLPLAILLAAAVWVLAAGDAGDPLASLSYLTGTFTKTVDRQVDEALDDSDEALRSRLENGTAASSAAVWQETRLKEGDVLRGVTGTSVLLLAGRARVTYEGGAVVDATAGSVVPSGSALTANHRYIAAEDTSAAFAVTSATAVVDYQGSYALELSDKPDYNAMASALKTLHLFKGTFTG